jgi:hypothetical protein
MAGAAARIDDACEWAKRGDLSDPSVYILA